MLEEAIMYTLKHSMTNFLNSMKNSKMCLKLYSTAKAPTEGDPVALDGK